MTRETTRLEDEAYCLLGLFNINMPTLYGEGIKAFARLQEEILKQSSDTTLFAWGECAELSQLSRMSYAAFNTKIHDPDPKYCLFAPSPRVFLNSSDIEFRSIASSWETAPLWSRISGGPDRVMAKVPSFSVTPNGAVAAQLPLLTVRCGSYSFVDLGWWKSGRHLSLILLPDRSTNNTITQNRYCIGDGAYQSDSTTAPRFHARMAYLCSSTCTHAGCGVEKQAEKADWKTVFLTHRVPMTRTTKRPQLFHVYMPFVADITLYDESIFQFSSSGGDDTPDSASFESGFILKLFGTSRVDTSEPWRRPLQPLTSIPPFNGPLLEKIKLRWLTHSGDCYPVDHFVLRLGQCPTVPPQALDPDRAGAYPTWNCRWANMVSSSQMNTPDASPHHDCPGDHVLTWPQLTRTFALPCGPRSFFEFTMSVAPTPALDDYMAPITGSSGQAILPVALHLRGRVVHVDARTPRS